MVRSRQSAWWGIKWWLINLLLSWSSNWELYETPSSQPVQPTVVQHKTLIHTCTHTFSNMQIYMQPPNVASHQLGCAHPHTQTQMHTHTHTLPVVSSIHWVSRPAFAMTCVGDLLKHGNAEVCAGKYLLIYLLSESENLINKKKKFLTLIAI